MLCFLQKLKKNCRRNGERGTTAVEMALIAPVFFFMFFGIIEVSLVMLGQHMLENATFNASRMGKTGYVASGKTQLETVRAILITELGSLAPLIDISLISFQTASFGTLSLITEDEEEGASNLGGATEVVVYTVSYPWRIFTPMLADIMGNEDGNIVLTSRLVVRNEPY